MDALVLDNMPGKRKFGVLHACMGRECVIIYNLFVWALKVVCDADAGIVAVPAKEK
ncbi:hypothetical protein DPMN_172924 [Dreissena polymorpha]|uniref:Uncharacterized protein n=1 Tax=Dreissena polymorpha TaxID=45954 RepID=A0A9D4E2G4_DREPO|nr:hypothetical protein DPMN_172924 [Dreissena polymorpha]